MNQQFYADHTVFASQGKRFANFLIDTIISYLLVIVLTFVATILAELLNFDALLLWLFNISPIQDLLVTVGIRLGYYIIMESAFQVTIGKLITGTKVIHDDGSKPDLGTIGVRTLCRLIPFEQFSFLGSEARGWHDSLSKTYVVDVRKYNAEVQRQTSLNEIGQLQEQ